MAIVFSVFVRPMHGGNLLQSHPHQDAVECSQSEWDCAVKGLISVKNSYKLFL